MILMVFAEPRKISRLMLIFDTGKTFYVYGGGNSVLVARPDPDNDIWAFKADGQGGGAWSSAGTVPSSLIRTSAALVSKIGNGIGYSIGGNGPSGAVQGMVEYNMKSQSWTNSSTTALSTNGTAVDGQLIYSSVFGEEGILIALDGADGTTGEISTLSDFSTIKIYDVKSGNWYDQATSGIPPDARVTFCAVASHSDSSMEIFIHGGFSGFTTLAYDDVWVLSLPSFSWYKADYTPGIGRTLHTCDVANGNMIVIGGTSNDDSWITGNDVTGTQSYKDPWPWGIGVFDMSRMEWASEFNPNLGPYTTPVMVAAGIAANGSEPASWGSDDLKKVFSHTILTQSSSSPSGSSSSSTSTSTSSTLSTGAIAGIAIGAVALLLLGVLGLFFLRRHQRRSRAGHNPFPRENNAYPMNYSQAGGQYSPTQTPLIVEADGVERREKNTGWVGPAELEQGVGGGGPQEKMGRNEEGGGRGRFELP
jgi:hypothetical protein